MLLHEKDPDIKRVVPSFLPMLMDLASCCVDEEASVQVEYHCGSRVAESLHTCQWSRDTRNLEVLESLRHPSWLILRRWQSRTSVHARGSCVLDLKSWNIVFCIYDAFQCAWVHSHRKVPPATV